MTRFILACTFFIASCASNERKLERLRDENPGCEITEYEEIKCPLPFVSAAPEGPYETISKEEVEQITGVMTDRRLTVSCKLREQPSMNSKIVGYMPKGRKINVEKVNNEWNSYYGSDHGRLVYVGSKCFNSGVKHGKRK